MDKERAERALKKLSSILDRCPRQIRHEGLQEVLGETIDALDSGAKREDIREIFLKYIKGDTRSSDCYH